jgi:hypothetical protein
MALANQANALPQVGMVRKPKTGGGMGGQGGLNGKTATGLKL